MDNLRKKYRELETAYEEKHKENIKIEKKNFEHMMNIDILRKNSIDKECEIKVI